MQTPSDRQLVSLIAEIYLSQSKSEFQERIICHISVLVDQDVIQVFMKITNGRVNILKSGLNKLSQ